MKRCKSLLTTTVAMACMAPMPAAYAVKFNTGNEDLQVRWDNTVKYSAAFRLKDQSPVIIADRNADDGDRNFDQGLISNRLDLLSEFDLSYRNVGLRLSGAAWYDQVYNKSNDNDSPATANPLSVPFNEFTRATRDLHGRRAELLDAFVFGRTDLGDMTLTGRLGKHTLLYGESLFFGANGIAGAQTAVDIIKAQSVPSTPFKELLMPIAQVSGQLQIRPNLSVGAYYQFDWKRNRIPASGSYFSTLDVLDDGGERSLGGPTGTTTIPRRADLEARNSGQGGIQLRFRPESHDAEYGLYAARFHSKSPLLYVNGASPPVGFPPLPPPATNTNEYRLVFPEGIEVYGVSASTTLGDTNVASEISYRRNTPFVRPALYVNPLGSRDNKDNPAYAVGDSLHAQISWVMLLKATGLWEGGNLLGEIAWHRRQSVNKNAAALDPNSTRSASALRVVFSPKYFNVISGLDLNVPIGIGYGISGRSPVINPGFSVEHGGDVSIGLAADYLRVWRFGINYTHYFGDENGGTLPVNVFPPAKFFTYDQALKDRDFISLIVQYSF
jgi:Protein of unknown function (DUF1302)